MQAVHVRKTVWFIFACALMLALALPMAITIHQCSAALQARVSVWPAHPQVGETVHLTVSLVGENDQAAARGPWAQLIATWDMAAMEMGAEQATVQGAQNDNGTLTIPLQLTMPGSWLIHATLQTPARPTWHGTIAVIVAPPPATTLTPASVTGTGNTVSTSCGRSGGLPL